MSDAEESATTAVTTAVNLIPQPHGGALLPGGKPGNRGGTGVRDEVREKLAGIANGKGIEFLDQLMEGKARFRLVGVCESCGHEAKDPHSKAETDAMWDEIKATVENRLKASDQILKYGVAGKDDVARPKILALIASWRDVLTKHNAPESMLDELTKVTNEWEMKL